ncbi:hypothetical protein [Bacillus mycoides]|uniref:hypothetical protein n=1 Tax=Bacillus mycoides TaxID=1405 RepID=UPI002E20D706|nr:hypothetical protein [Bacillus mycoides]
MKETGKKVFGKDTGASKAEGIPSAFEQEEFASTYEERRNQIHLFVCLFEVTSDPFV